MVAISELGMSELLVLCFLFVNHLQGNPNLCSCIFIDKCLTNSLDAFQFTASFSIVHFGSLLLAIFGVKLVNGITWYQFSFTVGCMTKLN